MSPSNLSLCIIIYQFYMHVYHLISHIDVKSINITLPYPPGDRIHRVHRGTSSTSSSVPFSAVTRSQWKSCSQRCCRCTARKPSPLCGVKPQTLSSVVLSLESFLVGPRLGSCMSIEVFCNGWRWKPCLHLQKLQRWKARFGTVNIRKIDGGPLKDVGRRWPTSHPRN